MPIIVETSKMRPLAYLLPVAFGLSLTALAYPASAQVTLGIAVRSAPPALPVYAQPPLPGPGYIWTPGFWAYAPDSGFYWVPGTWALPPEPDLFWTPAWWGFADGAYDFHPGYWGPHVGYYGGINYGFGYGGVGFTGGRWDQHNFVYNGAVNNLGHAHLPNVYHDKPPAHPPGMRASFNGGPSGYATQPTPDENNFGQEKHAAPTAEQAKHFQGAGENQLMRAIANHGHPMIAATARPGEFNGRGVTHAEREAPHAEHEAPERH